jgi:hypothetical protein
MATAYLNRATIDHQQRQPQHPYIIASAIAEAMKHVPDKNELICFISIMQVISNHSCDKQLSSN